MNLENTSNLPYPYVVDSGIQHDLEWFEYEHFPGDPRPNYKVGHILAPNKLPVPTGHITILKIVKTGDGGLVYVVRTDFGNIITVYEEDLKEGYIVLGKCDNIKDHIKHQINNLTEILGML